MKRLLVLLTIFYSFSVSASDNKKNLDGTEADKYSANAILFEDSVKNLYDQLNAASYNLNYEAFRYAYIGYKNLKALNKINEKEIFSIIDFTKKSDEKRFYTIDLERKIILFNTYVSHGKKSGYDTTKYFSDKNDSNKSSLGFYITGKTYNGTKGFSLKLHGDEKGYNSNMYKRGVVIHTANYASAAYAQKNGRLGRSLGCPVLPTDIYKSVIEVIKNKTMIFAYYTDKNYLQKSKYLKLDPILKSADF